MKIYVPWVDLKGRTIHPELLNLLRTRGIFVNLTNNDTGYFQLVTKLWAMREDFIIVEQDNVPLERDLELMETCTNAWCVCPYKGPMRDGSQIWIGGMGCIRFRSQLMEQIPNFAQEIATSYSPNHLRYHWHGLDWAITVALKRRGLRQCWHHEVAHLHDY